MGSTHLNQTICTQNSIANVEKIIDELGFGYVQKKTSKVIWIFESGDDLENVSYNHFNHLEDNKGRMGVKKKLQELIKYSLKRLKIKESIKWCTKRLYPMGREKDLKWIELSNKLMPAIRRAFNREELWNYVDSDYSTLEEYMLNIEGYLKSTKDGIYWFYSDGDAYQDKNGNWNSVDLSRYSFIGWKDKDWKLIPKKEWDEII